MVIEWLRFTVKPGFRARFITFDRWVWTATLSAFPGFLRKSVWTSPGDDTEVVIVIEWASRKDWMNVPARLLEATERRFAAAVGPWGYRLREARAFQVRDR
ncbi:MAG TPA: TIGR03792 family protein [Longimicrobium sp.]|nr:TIGR03792 family protein [Longimicrobium sp.]